SLESVPAGNLVNLRRTDSTISVLQLIDVQWTGDVALPLTISVFRDNISVSDALTSVRADPPSPTPVGLNRGFFSFDQPGQRFGLQLTITPTALPWKLLAATLVFEPLMGD